MRQFNKTIKRNALIVVVKYLEYFTVESHSFVTKNLRVISSHFTE